MALKVRNCFSKIKPGVLIKFWSKLCVIKSIKHELIKDRVKRELIALGLVGLCQIGSTK